MFPNLEAEMARKIYTRVLLAKEMNVSPNTITKKLNGSAPIYLKECLEIKNILNVKMPLEKLFATKL